jgi:hypothetical protein
MPRRSETSRLSAKCDNLSNHDCLRRRSPISPRSITAALQALLSHQSTSRGERTCQKAAKGDASLRRPQHDDASAAPPLNYRPMADSAVEMEEGT